MSSIRNRFQRSSGGVLFSKTVFLAIMPRITDLTKKNGFDSVLELMSILHDLSISRSFQTLSDSSLKEEISTYKSRRIEKIM